MKRTTGPDSQTPRRPLVLTGEGGMWVWVTVLLAALGWYKSINLVLLLAYAMLALLLLNAVLARRHARRVRVTCEPSPPVFAGEETRIRLTATNTSTYAATVTVSEQTDSTPINWLIYQLPGQSSATCTGGRIFPTRGRYTAPVRVTSAFPFGLVQYSLAGEAGADIIVLPRLGIANADGMRRWLHQAAGAGRARKVLPRVTTDQADVRGVRPYRPGDPIRAIHWRSTARRRELMVREYDDAPALELVLVVEPWLPGHPTPEHLANLEAALSLAATIVSTWGQSQGTAVMIVIAGDANSVRTASPNDAEIRIALEPLATVQGVSAFDVLGAQVFGRSLMRAVSIVVSSRPDSPQAEMLTQATGRLFLAVPSGDRLPWYQPPVIPGARG